MSIEQIVSSVQSFNNLAGNPAGCALEKGNNSSSMYDSLIAEEIQETKAAFEELLDGCADIVVVALGKLHVTNTLNLNELVQDCLYYHYTPAEFLSFIENAASKAEPHNLSKDFLEPDPVVVLNTAIELCKSLGIDPYKVLKEVCAANMSKFCTTQEEAEKSVESYQFDSRYVNVHYVYNKQEQLYVILGNKVDDSDPYKVLKGTKILKGINTFKPNLSKFLF